MTWWSRTAGVLAIVALASCALRPPPPAPVRRTDLTLTTSTSTLANGLRVVLVRDPEAAEVQVTMRYRVGAVNDPPDQPGMAHLVEHLMYQQVLGARSLFARLEDLATHFQGITTFDATTYVARADVSHLGELLSIEAVRLGFRCTTIDDSVFVREREVVINEVRLHDHATEVLAAIHRGLFPATHPYRRSVAGSEASVAAITRDQACAFADAHYAPGNAVLVVSGPVAPPELATALGKFLARVAPRAAAPPTVVPRVEPVARQSRTDAAVGVDALLVAWPLPEDPSLRAKVRAIASATSSSIDRAVAGRVVVVDLGDHGAPMVGVFVTLTEDDTMPDVVRRVRGAIAETPAEFAGRGLRELREILFNTRKQGAIYDLVATLDDVGKRDTMLAAAVLSGREPSNAIGEELAGLGTLSRGEAAQVARDHLGIERAILVELTASERVARRRKPTLRPPVHDLGQRRDAGDPSEAARPMAGALVAGGASAATRRTLPNGLGVVLVPSTGVPAVEVRLVFGAGTGDELPAKRGAAVVAGYALTWDLRHLKDALAFSEAGGALSADIGFDHTSFAVRGLTMHVDYLLAGLRRWVRDGKYDRGAKVIFKTLRREAKNNDDEGVITDAWRTARFGPGHPYVDAGLVRRVSPTLTIEDVKAFRAAHYTPANATLVIAGNFDPVLANQWIDYLFADWKGGASPRAAPRAALHPASLAVVTDLDQVAVTIALPATAGGRAEQLIAGQMLSEIAGDVRHQLGATYGLSATVYEARLATSYVLEGTIDRARLGDTVELLRARIEALRTDADAAARAFVTARKRVVRRLLAPTGTAAALADRAQHELVLGREPTAAVDIAREVHDMTIDRMAPTLAEVDLAGAAVVMFGRAAEIDRVFAALGRTPTHIQVNPDDDDTPTTAPASRPSRADGDDDRDDGDDRVDRLRPSDLADALTDQPPTRLALAVMPGYATAASLSLRDGVDVSGYSISAAIGYRLTHTTALGARLSLGSLAGTYDVGRFQPDLRPIAVVPLSIGAYSLATLTGRVFGGAFVALHLARITDDQRAPAWEVGVGLGLEVGVDLVGLHRHRLGVFGRAETQLGPKNVVPMLSLGVAYLR